MEQEKIYLNNCPVCDHTHASEIFKVKDHSTSKEVFSIVTCNNCGFHFTNPRPTEETLGRYYESDAYISHTDSNKGLMNRLYQYVRNKAIKSKEQLILSVADEKTLLDVGCGTGDFLKYCQKKDWKVLGLEPNHKARAIAQKKGIEVKNLDALDAPGEKYNVITMWHVLEHLYDLKGQLEKIISHLQSKGHLIIAVPNHSSWDAKHYKEFWAAWDVPIHLYHFRPEDIKTLAGQFDLHLEDILPMKYDAYYVSMLSEKYKGNNQWRGIWRGFQSNKKAKKGTWSSQIYVLKKK